MYKKIVLSIICCIGLLSCSKTSTSIPAEQEVGQSTMSNGVFSNDYLDFTIRLPSDMYLVSDEEQKQIMSVGAQALGSSDGKELEAIEHSTVNLFSLFEHKLGSDKRPNAGLSAIAERVDDSVTRGSDYLTAIKRLLERSDLFVQFPREVYTEEFSGISFDTLEVQLLLPNTSAYQKYYAVKRKNYILLFTMNTYQGQRKTRKNLDNIMSTLKFY